MLSQHTHTHLRPIHKPGHPQYHGVTVDGTGTRSYATPSQYEHVVLRLLHRIHHSHTGQAVFHEFGKHPHHLMKIVPLENVFNAYAAATDLLHATRSGQVERSGADGGILFDFKGKPIVGQGGGSDSVVSFTPLTFSKYCSQQKKGHKVGAQPDEVLFHEMVHATRHMRGLLNPLPLGFLYDTEEEFFAILLANIYASETGRAVDLRSDHAGFEHLNTDTNAKFLPKRDMGDYRYRLVCKLVQEEPRMAHELNRLHHVPFNPVRRYFELERTSVQVRRHP
jgi:hypothetical protein